MIIQTKERGCIMELDKLNNKQKEAVFCTEGPLLVLAGAGSGKTRVLTHKIAYLIDRKNVNPFSILAITFTNKAAKEMKERVFSLIGERARDIQISTYHSFGYKIIRENYWLLKLDKNFNIMDESDSITLIKKILKDLNLDPNHYSPKGIKNIISNNKNELITSSQYIKYANTEWDKIVLKVYQKYQETLLKNNAVDFDDLLMMPILLFKDNKEVLKKYQEKYQYILVDEYQDTNEAQYTLTKLIGSKYKNVCVVGDGDQCIYSWRGANYRNILNFEKDFSNAKVILLEKNYRSTKNILDVANNVIKNNSKRKDKNLVTDNVLGSKIKYFQALDEKDESNYIAGEIKKISNKSISYDDIAVLYRTNAQSRAIEESFMVEKIPYKVIGSFSFYNRKEIKDLVAYLKLIYNEKDDIALLRCINNPKRGIGAKKIANLMEKAEQNQKSIYDVIESNPELEFKEIIETLKEIYAKNSLTELIEAVLEKTGLITGLENERTLEADIRLENLREFKSITKAFEEKNGIISLEEFLMELSLVSNSEELKEENDKVSLMTMHAAKGLEFKVVFITGLEEGITPHINAMDLSEDLEEERRLFYVGITRAKELLYLLNTKTRLLFGDRRSNIESRFISEVGEDFIEKEIASKTFDNDNLFYDNVDFNIGEVINHEKFGEGIIQEYDDKFITVSFSYPYMTKKLMKNHKSIIKLGKN